MPLTAVNAENIFILPNNKNIILAANQAQLLEREKKVFVVPTKTIPQGITAIINYNAGEDSGRKSGKHERRDFQSPDRTGDLRSAGYPHR